MSIGEHPSSAGALTQSDCAQIGIEKGRTIWRAGKGGDGDWRWFEGQNAAGVCESINQV